MSLRIGALFAALLAMSVPGGALAASAEFYSTSITHVTVETVEIVEEEESFLPDAPRNDTRLAYALWDEGIQGAPGNATPNRGYLAAYGPFRVIDGRNVEMVGTVDSDAPADFAAMRMAWPGIDRLVMVECPGSDDDAANLRLARLVRAAGMSTHVPAGGSVRSGAVELFLAGVHRTADPRAEFAVHSWRDEDGLEAWQASENDPVHREYLDYYRDMGISNDTARRFYALTNSVPYDNALYLAPRDFAAMGLLN
ncbi:MAG: alpha/beta hydrolase [Blastomonas sp.]